MNEADQSYRLKKIQKNLNGKYNGWQHVKNLIINFIASLIFFIEDKINILKINDS